MIAAATQSCFPVFANLITAQRFNQTARLIIFFIFSNTHFIRRIGRSFSPRAILLLRNTRTLCRLQTGRVNQSSLLKIYTIQYSFRTRTLSFFSSSSFFSLSAFNSDAFTPFLSTACCIFSFKDSKEDSRSFTVAHQR